MVVDVGREHGRFDAGMAPSHWALLPPSLFSGSAKARPQSRKLVKPVTKPHHSSYENLRFTNATPRLLLLFVTFFPSFNPNISTP